MSLHVCQVSCSTFNQEEQRHKTKYFVKFCVKKLCDYSLARFSVLLVKRTSSKEERGIRTQYLVKFSLKNSVTTFWPD